MRNVEVAVVLTLALVLVGLAAIYLVLDQLVPGSVTAATRTADVAKLAVAVAGILGAALTGVYAFRKQKLSESDALRADADHLLSRFTRSSDQLGDDSPAVRLAGIYAMAALADDWVENRQLCINVLTAYMQLPYDTDESSATFRHGEREVRRNLVRIIRDHLRGDGSSPSWRGHNFRFEGAVFDGGDLTRAELTGGHVTFHGARFVGGTFHIHGAVIDGASVWFTDARFEGGVVDFTRMHLRSGRLDFTGASVSGSTIEREGFHQTGGDLVHGDVVGLSDTPAA